MKNAKKLNDQQIAQLKRLLERNGECRGDHTIVCANCVIKTRPCKPAAVNAEAKQLLEDRNIPIKRLLAKPAGPKPSVAEMKTIKAIHAADGSCVGMSCSTCPIKKYRGEGKRCETDSVAKVLAGVIIKKFDPVKKKPVQTDIITLEDQPATPVLILETIIANLVAGHLGCKIAGGHCKNCPITTTCRPRVADIKKLRSKLSYLKTKEKAAAKLKATIPMVVDNTPVETSYKKGTWVKLKNVRGQAWNESGAMDYLIGKVIKVTRNIYSDNKYYFFIHSDETCTAVIRIGDIERVATPEEIVAVQPVTSYPKDAWVKLKNERCTGWNSIGQMDYLMGAVVQLANSVTELRPSFDVSRAGSQHAWSLHLDDIERIATPDEIKQATTRPILKFGDVEFKIEKGYATTSYGKATQEDIENAIKWILNPPSIAGHEFRIHVPGRSAAHASSYRSVETLGLCNDKDEIRIGFGCQTGTLAELKAILAAMKNS